MSGQFTKDVNIYKRDKDGAFIKDAEDRRIIEREIGSFVFKRPTIRDEAEMRIARKKLLAGVNANELDDFDRLYIEFCVYFPRLAVSTPERWNWDYIEPLTLMAVLDSFIEGLNEID